MKKKAIIYFSKVALIFFISGIVLPFLINSELPVAFILSAVCLVAFLIFCLLENPFLLLCNWIKKIKAKYE